LEYYKIFYYVTKFKSITVAAERLSLTQPNITKQIKRLEEDLQCKLFNRTNKGVELTPEGETLWARIESACELIIEAEQQLELGKMLGGGTLSIAATEMNFSAYVLPALQLFLKDHPKVKVRIRAQIYSQMLEMLKKGLVDLAVLSPVEDPDESFQFHTIDVYEQVMIVGPQYSFLANREYTLEELLQYPFISMPEGFPGRANMEYYFRKSELIYEPKVEVHSMELMIQAAAADLGIGIVPLKVVEDRIRNGVLFKLNLKDKLPNRRALAITNRSGAVNTATQVFIKEYLLRHDN